MPTYEEVYNRLSNNKSAENNSLQRTEPSIRTWENYLAKISAGYEPINQSEPENSSGVWDYLTSGNIIDSAQAGLGHMGKHIGKTIEDVTRPDDISIPDWHEQDSFAKRLQDYSAELIRNNSHQYEQNSVPYFLDMAVQSTPEFLTDLGISMAIGAALGGPAGAVVGGGANLLLKAKKARDLVWAISKAYQGSSKAAKAARAIIPGSAQEAIALGSGAVMEAHSEALDAEERYIEKAKANGTYVRGQTEEEARAIYNQVLKDQTAIISAFNVPQYGAIYGKAAKGLLGKAGTLAKAIVPEAAEEMSQYADTQYRLDDPLTAQGFIDSGVTGALMGGAMHVAGRGGRYLADRIAGNPTDEQREAAELARKAFSKQNSRQTQNIYDDFRGEVSEALNSSETAARDAYGQAYNEAQLTNKQAEIWEAAQYASVRAKEKFGYDIPPELIYKQWAHEAGVNFDSLNARYNNNFGGLTQTEPNGEENRQQDGGTNYYRHFNNVREYADAYVDDFIRHYPEINGVKNEREFASVLKNYGYFTDDLENYVSDMEGITAPSSRTNFSNEQDSGGNIFGVENYDMPAEQMESSVEGLKAGWSEVIPQIGGVLKSMGYDPVLTSAARTREHQMRINPDAPNSYHIIQDDGGDAIDISLSENELTPEQEQAVLDYFKGTGLFNEVLYHSVVGGKHLHLGGLNTEKLRNGQSIQSRADQIFSENYNPNEHKPPQWNDYYNDRRKQRQGQQQQRQEDTSQNKSEPPKPLFDLNAEDPQTQKLLERFAMERRNSSTGAQAAQDSVFFEPMFKDGKFQNTPENRAAVMERYGDEFTAWAQPLLQQNQPSQTETNTPPKTNNEPLIKTANEFLEKLKAQGGTENIATIFKLQTALDNGDTATIENILRQNGNATPSEQAQPQEDPVQNNQPPENVLSQPEQQTQENQTPPQVNANTYVQAALVQPVGGTSKAAKDARIEQGKKLQVLADQHGVKIPEPIKVSLNHGAIKAITETQKRLLDSGKLFNSEPQQIQTPQAQTKFADDLSLAKQEIPQDKNARKSQGESILRVVNFSQNVNSLYPNGNSPIPRIDLPAGLEQALQRGDEKAIRKAQEIIENAGLKIETSPQGTTAPTTGNTRGNTAEVITGSRTPHQIRYKVVEASDLNTSHLIDNGGVFANENYPAELQPRDRERSDMQARLISMGNNLTPADLLDARDVNQGAPVTRNDGVVLNGNGRTAAIRYAYEKGKGDPYKNALIQNAEKFGLNADEISKMNQPVLVRELTHSLTDEEMRDLTGTQTGGARMGASEQAQADAAKLSQATLNQFPQGDNVDLSQAESTDFLRAVLNDIASPDELNSLTTADGKISQEGINRVRRALFANAYGDKGVVSRMSESTDDNVRGITNALLNAAPTIAKVQAAMKNGTAHNHDLSVIAKAVEKLSTLRDEGKPVSKYLQEQGLFAEHADSEEVKEILSFFDKNKHAPNKIAAFLKNIANRIQNQGDPREENLFGSNEPAPLIDLIKDARRELENNGQQNIFTQEESKSETPKEKFATGKENGNDEPVDTSTENVVAEKNLTPQQKLIVKFGKILGTEVVFVDNPDSRFLGVHKEGKTFINVNSKMPLGKVFWHESLHWLRNNNPELYKSLVKAAGITDAQRKAYLEETERTDLTTDAEIDEEIIADQFQDVAKRTGLLQSIAGKNRGLIQRVVQWLKDTMNKFIDHFRNPSGKLTTKQAQALADEFGRIATQLKDPNGDKIFRYNRRTHNIELADGRDLTESAIEEMTRKGMHHPVKYTFAGKRGADFANRAKLAEAQQMEEDGKSRSAIFKKTGWIKGKDNKWRFEIPDNLDKINFDELQRDGQSTLGEIYDNPKLYRAYPFLSEMIITKKAFKGTKQGEFQASLNRIALSEKLLKENPGTAKEVLVHEIQHAIQRYEHFATGGSDTSANAQINHAMTVIEDEFDNILNPGNAKVIFIAERDLKQELKQENSRLEKLSESKKKRLEYLATRYAELSKALKSRRMTDYDKYWNLGGEQEAREVSDRARKLQTTLNQTVVDNSKLVRAETALKKFESKATPEQRAAANELVALFEEVKGDPFADGVEYETRDKIFNLTETLDNDDWFQSIQEVQVAKNELENKAFQNASRKASTQTPKIHDKNALIVFGGNEYSMASMAPPENKKTATKSVNPKADNERVTQKAQNLLKAVGLEKRRPKSKEKLGKVYGRMENDGTFTAEISKLDDPEKLEYLKSMANEIGATYNAETKKFHFNDIERVAVFFKAARTAFHDKTSNQNNYDRQVSGTVGVELPEGYRTETGKPLQESKIYDFIVNEDGDKNFGEITPEIEQETNGLVKASPIRLQVGNIEFGYIHLISKHLAEIERKGFNNAISYINNILQNIDRIYISAETGSLNRFLLCSNGAKGHSDNFMPIDLELEQGEDGYYRIVTAYPKSGKNVEGILLFEDSTHSSSDTATDSLPRLTDNKNGDSRQRANAKSNIPSKGIISQSERDSKPKYSIGASEKPSFFDKAAKKLKKALGIDHDRVRTVEDQRQAHSEAQKKAMDTYLRDPSKENKEKLRALRVTNEQLEAYQNGEEYMNSLGLIQNVGGSPSRVADKNIIFRAFFNLGDKAMDRLIRERDTFMRHYDKAMSLVKSKEDFEQFASLLWLGDTTQQEFTKEELLREGVPENVAEAYTQIRRQIERGYQMADKVQRRAREHAEYLTDEQIDDLHDNKFAYDIKDLNKVDDDGKKLVRWQEYENHVQTVRVTEKALEKLRADDSIQILSEKQLKQGNDKGKYDVKFREGKPTLQHLKGYIPHFFHKYAVVIKDSNGKQIGGILGTGNTEREAIKLADEWLKNHNLESDREIYISPFEFNAEGALGMNSNYAPTVGDKDFNAMLKNIAKNSEMSLAKAKKLLDGSVKLKNRHRFLGQLMQRNGYKGYEKDMAWVLQHHFNSLSRYVALESEFKPQAISLFERVFGAFDKDHSKNLLAQYTKNYINDVNGVPAWIDEVTNKALNQNPAWRKYFLPVLGERGVQTVAENITSRIAYLKLGMLNISSAVINYTQLTNAAGYLGSPTQLMKHFGQIAARGGKLTIGEMKILMGSGVAQDIGLDTSSGYDKNRGQNAIPGLDWLGNKSMKLFQNCDSLCRAATALAAYDKAIAEGKTKQQALNYAKEINRKANFSYGVEDAPNAMRRTGAYGKVMLQFYKYPFKQLEVISDFMPQSTRTTFKQKAMFWIPYIFQAGLMGLIPGFDWSDELLNEKFRLFPKDFLQKLCIKGTQEVFGKDSEVGKKVAQVMMYGAPALLGADVSKRVGLASLMPQDLPSFLLGAAGTTIVDGTRGAYNWAMHDEPGVNAVRAISPGLANIYTAAIEGETKDYRGRKVSIYETAWDRILRGMGFRSTDESVAADVQRINFNSRSDRLKDEQRAIDAYIADRSPENLKRLKELHIKPERVKEESRKKKLDRRGRLEQNMTKRERMDNRYLLEFAR